MGISNRDYLHEDPPTRFGGAMQRPGGLSAVAILIIINVAVFLFDQQGRWLTGLCELRLTGWNEIALDETPVYVPVPLKGQPPTRTLNRGIRIEQLRTGRQLVVKLQRNAANEEIVGKLSAEFLAELDGFVEVAWYDELDKKVMVGVIPADAIRSVGGFWQLPWRIIAYGFCHGGFEHILFNMYSLWLFGHMIESIYGRREFLAMYLTGVVISGLCHLLFQLFQGNDVPVIGASGGVMAVVFLTAMHFPRRKLLLFLFLPIEMRWLAVMYAVLDISGMVGGGGTGIAHAAHLGGAAFGYAYHRFDWRVLGFWDRVGATVALLKRRVAGTSVGVYRPPETGINDEVDALLQKIHERGESSLTDRERETLKEASRRLRRR